MQKYLDIAEQKREAHYRSRCKPVTNLNTGEEYSGAYEVTKKYPGVNVTGAITHNRKVLGCYWQYKDIVDKNGREAELQKCIEKTKTKRLNAAKQNSKVLAKPVVCLELHREYESGSEAARQLNLDHTSISNAIKNRTKAGGYYWQYKDVVEKSSIEEELQNCIDHTKQKKQDQTNFHKKQVMCIETQQIFPSAKEASLSLGNNKNLISHAIRHNYTAAGYHWKYIEQDSES